MESIFSKYGLAVVYEEDRYQPRPLCLIDMKEFVKSLTGDCYFHIQLAPENISDLPPEIIYTATVDYLESALSTVRRSKRNNVRIKRLYLNDDEQCHGHVPEVLESKTRQGAESTTTHQKLESRAPRKEQRNKIKEELFDSIETMKDIVRIPSTLPGNSSSGIAGTIAKLGIGHKQLGSHTGDIEQLGIKNADVDVMEPEGSVISSQSLCLSKYITEDPCGDIDFCERAEMEHSVSNQTAQCEEYVASAPSVLKLSRSTYIKEYDSDEHTHPMPLVSAASSFSSMKTEESDACLGSPNSLCQTEKASSELETHYGNQSTGSNAECSQTDDSRDRSRNHSQPSSGEQRDEGAAGKERKSNVKTGRIEIRNKMQCPVCLKYLSTLRDHMKIHADERPYICETCGKSFRQSSSLRGHMYAHSNEKPFLCPVCGDAFRRKRDVGSHMKKHTQERPYGCETCDKKFQSNGNLRKHIRTHTGERPYECQCCGKKFQQRYHLTAHLLTHTGEKPFICQLCGKGFAKKSYMDSHHAVCHQARSHTGKNQNVCQCAICGKCFSQKSSLRVHARLHTGEKPFVCSVCGKGFAAKYRLVMHTRVHTGEKPYKCEWCGKSFTNIATCINHRRTHTGEKPYICQLCDRRFARRSNLVSHLNTHERQKAREQVKQNESKK